MSTRHSVRVCTFIYICVYAIELSIYDLFLSTLLLKLESSKCACFTFESNVCNKYVRHLFSLYCLLLHSLLSSIPVNALLCRSELPLEENRTKNHIICSNEHELNGVCVTRSHYQLSQTLKPDSNQVQTDTITIHSHKRNKY